MIRKAVAAEPENAAYLDSLGWVLFKLGKYEEALSPLEKAAEMRTGGDGTIYEHLGDVYDKLGRAADAQKAWAKAMEKSRAERLPDEKLLKRLEEKLGTAAKPKEEAKPAGVSLKVSSPRPDVLSMVSWLPVIKPLCASQKLVILRGSLPAQEMKSHALS